MRKLKPGEIRVIVRDAWRVNKTLNYKRGYFNRPFVGIAVAEALTRLEGRDASHPKDGVQQHCIMSPYYLNGTRVERTSTEVIKAGDVLDVDDP